MAGELRQIRPRFGAGDLAATLGVTRASIYHWVTAIPCRIPRWRGKLSGSRVEPGLRSRSNKCGVMMGDWRESGQGSAVLIEGL